MVLWKCSHIPLVCGDDVGSAMSWEMAQVYLSFDEVKFCYEGSGIVA